jgi:hypothetical protein
MLQLMCAVCRRPVDWLGEGHLAGRKTWIAQCHGEAQTFHQADGENVGGAVLGVVFLYQEEDGCNFPMIGKTQ